MPTKPTTDPQNELLTEVDSNNKVIGPIVRKVAHGSPDKFYRTIMVVLKNSKDEILLQQRSSTKDLFPDCWSLSVGGHVDFGKSYLETAVRELEEELGIVASPKDLKFIGEVLVKLSKSNEFFYVFEYRLKPKDHINLETNEVSRTMWMSVGQVGKSMQQRKQKWSPRPVQIYSALY